VAGILTERHEAWRPAVRSRGGRGERTRDRPEAQPPSFDLEGDSARKQPPCRAFRTFCKRFCPPVTAIAPNMWHIGNRFLFLTRTIDLVVV
jgi:hypothetical protein